MGMRSTDTKNYISIFSITYEHLGSKIVKRETLGNPYFNNIRSSTGPQRNDLYKIHKSTKISEVMAWIGAHRKFNGSKLKPVLYDRGRYFPGLSTLKLYLFKKGGTMLSNMSWMTLKIYIPTTQTMGIPKMASFLRFTQQFDLQRSFYSKKMTFSTIFLLSSYMKCNFMYLANYLESSKQI